MRRSIESLFVKQDATILHAMQTITHAVPMKLPLGIVCVVDDSKKLMGVVTDGDIRKALVKKFTLEDKVEEIMVREPITVDEGLTLDEMIKTMLEKVEESKYIKDFKVEKIVVINKEGNVVDIVNFSKLWYEQEIKYKNICVIGTGHVGLILQIVLAESGLQVHGFDLNKSLIEGLKKGKTIFYEKGVEPLLNFCLKVGNLTFGSELKNKKTDTYIICVGTSVDEITKKPNYDSLIRASEDVGNALKKEDIVILRSTVSVGTTREVVVPILEKKSCLKAGSDFYVAFAPERVIEGNALEETMEIPQVIGGINKKSIQIATRIFQNVCPSIVVVDTLEEAEMVKLVNNSFRDLSFSFANKIAQISEQLNLDPVKIIKAAKDGYPRNPIPLPSPGVGGYCLTKDPYLMSEVAYKAKVGAEIFLEGRKINDAMPELVAKKVVSFVEKHWKDHERIKVYILGLAFKGFPETSDMRSSTSLEVIRHLRGQLKERLHLAGFDMVVPKNDIEELGVDYLNVAEGFNGSHCVLILNNHSDFAKMDIFRLIDTMKKPGLLFDGWSFFKPQEIKRVHNIFYEGLGGGY